MVWHLLELLHADTAASILYQSYRSSSARNEQEVHSAKSLAVSELNGGLHEARLIAGKDFNGRFHEEW